MYRKVFKKQRCRVSEKKELYVYKRKDKRWEARYIKGYTQDGKTLWGAVYGKTRTEVIKKRNEVTGQPEKENDKPATPTKLNLLILGAGSHGQNIKELAESLRVFSKISFLDDKATGDDIIGKCREAVKFRDEYICAFVAIGDNKKRRKWTTFLKEKNFLIPNIIAHSANISPKAVIGEGVAIMPQSTVNESEIGDFCILASNSLINNGAKVGSFSHIDCGGIVLKKKKVPENTWVKSGEIFGIKKSKETVETEES